MYVGSACAWGAYREGRIASGLSIDTDDSSNSENVRMSEYIVFDVP